MKWFFVAVKDRVTGDVVTVGSMLNIAEVHEIVEFLNRYNSTDFIIIKGEEHV